MKQAVQETHARNAGKTRFMGHILGYLYYRSYDEAPIRLTITGERDTSDTPYVVTGEAYLTLKSGKKLWQTSE